MENVIIYLIDSLAMPSVLLGMIVWYFKKIIDAKEKREIERLESHKKILLLLSKGTRSNSMLAVATAKAVQKIPEAHCNGDMAKALEVVEKTAEEEKEFLLKQGIDNII